MKLFIRFEMNTGQPHFALPALAGESQHFIPQEIKEKVRTRLAAVFGELPFYADLCAHKVDRIIADVVTYEDVDKKTTKVLLERYFEEDKFKEFGESGEFVLAQIKIIVTSCYVLLAFHDPRLQHFIWQHTEDIRRMYPQFQQQDAEELQLLLNFRNIVKIALQIVPPHKNKKFLLDIGGRLEGRAVYSEYITGSGQKDSVKKRLIIYYTEAKLQTDESEKLFRLTFTTSRPAAPTRDRPNANRKRVDDLPMTNESIAKLSQYPPDPIGDLARQNGYYNRPNPLVNVSPQVVQVISIMKRAFSDVWHFDLLMTLPLRLLIEDQLKLIADGRCDHVELTCVNEDDTLKRIYSVDSFQRKELRPFWERMRHIMTACKLFLLADTRAAQVYKMHQVTELFELYPEFVSLIETGDSVELEYLLRFRNFMKLGCVVVVGKPKIFLLRVVERLEGADNQYITGKGQTDATDRRVLIFARESGNDDSSAATVAASTPVGRTVSTVSHPGASTVDGSASLPSVLGTRTFSQRGDSDFDELPPPLTNFPKRETSLAAWRAHGLMREESAADVLQTNISPNIFREYSFMGPPPMLDPAAAAAPSNVFVVTPAFGNEDARHHVQSGLLAATPVIDDTADGERQGNDNDDDEDVVSDVDDFEDVSASGLDLNSLKPVAFLRRQQTNEVMMQHFSATSTALSRQTSNATVGLQRESSTGSQPNFTLSMPFTETSGWLASFPFTGESITLGPRPGSTADEALSTASHSTGDQNSAGAAPSLGPPLHLEKEFSVMPFHCMFQPLFTMPANGNVATTAAAAGAAMPSFTATASATTAAAAADMTSTASAAAISSAPAAAASSAAVNDNLAMLDTVEIFSMPFTQTIFGYITYTEDLTQQLNASIDRHNTNLVDEA